MRICGICQACVVTDKGTSYLSNGDEIKQTTLPFSSIRRATTYTPFRFTSIFGENNSKDKKLFVLIHDSNAFLESNLKYIAYEELDVDTVFVDMSFNESKETMELWYLDKDGEIKMKQILVNQKRILKSPGDQEKQVKVNITSEIVDKENTKKIDLNLQVLNRLYEPVKTTGTEFKFEAKIDKEEDISICDIDILAD